MLRELQALRNDLEERERKARESYSYYMSQKQLLDELDNFLSDSAKDS